MKTVRRTAAYRIRRISAPLVLAGSLFLLAGCSNVHRANMSPLDAAGMHPESLEQLQKYQVNADEVQQILIVGRAGMSEPGCVELVGMARSRHRAFMEGDAIAELLGSGIKENAVMQIVQLDQLNPFAGEAAAMRLAGLSEDVILDVARRRAKGQTVLAGARLAELKDAGYSNAQLVAMVDKGMTDKQADEAVARHDYAVGGHSFVRQHGRRR